MVTINNGRPSLLTAVGPGLKAALFMTLIVSDWVHLVSGSELSDLMEMVKTFKELEDEAVPIGGSCDLKVTEELSQDMKKLMTATNDISVQNFKEKYKGVKDAKNNFNIYKSQAKVICKARDNIICVGDPSSTPADENKGTCQSCEDASLKESPSCHVVSLIKTYDSEADTVLELLQAYQKGEEVVVAVSETIEKGKEIYNKGVEKAKETGRKVKEKGKAAYNRLKAFGGSSRTTDLSRITQIAIGITTTGLLIITLFAY